MNTKTPELKPKFKFELIHQSTKSRARVGQNTYAARHN